MTIQTEQQLECIFCKNKIPCSLEYYVPDDNEIEQWLYLAKFHKKKCTWVKNKGKVKEYLNGRT